jgi:hypothetical protein
MIRHFLRYDFLVLKLHWIILGIMTLILWPIWKAGMIRFDAFAFIYFISPVSALQLIIGTTWRSQHVISVFYLLSLPVERKRLYWIVQVRAMVMFLPLIIVLSITPFVTETELMFYFRDPGRFLAYFIFTLGGVVWMINKSIWTQQTIVKITSHLTLVARFRSWCLLLGTYLIEICVVIGSLALIALGVEYFFLGALAMVGLAGITFIFARRKWIGV